MAERLRVHTLRIPCTDLAAAEAFYATLIGHGKSFGSAAEGYVGFALDNATILLERLEAGEFEAGRYLGFSLEVEDIARFYARATAQGIEFTHPPERQPWGGTMTHVIDASRNVFSIVQMDAAD